MMLEHKSTAHAVDGSTGGMREQVFTGLVSVSSHARIYDRLLEMCAPICFSGENFRKATAQDKLARLKNLMD